MSKPKRVNRFFVKFHYGIWQVIDRNTQKMAIGYSTKNSAQLTADGLNRIRKPQNVTKMVASLKTLKGYGHYIRLANSKNPKK